MWRGFIVMDMSSAIAFSSSRRSPKHVEDIVVDGLYISSKSAEARACLSRILPALACTDPVCSGRGITLAFSTLFVGLF